MIILILEILETPLSKMLYNSTAPQTTAEWVSMIVLLQQKRYKLHEDSSCCIRVNTSLPRFLGGSLKYISQFIECLCAQWGTRVKWTLTKWFFTLCVFAFSCKGSLLLLVFLPPHLGHLNQVCSRAVIKRISGCIFTLCLCLHTWVISLRLPIAPDIILHIHRSVAYLNSWFSHSLLPTLGVQFPCQHRPKTTRHSLVGLHLPQLTTES